MIIDLRDYTTTPGCRDRLIERCETTLFPEQVRFGATFLGSFRDAEHPDRFVWLRGMPSMAERQRILTDFYTNGAMWRAQRREVNTWIADSSNVLLLRPLTPLATAPATAPVGESLVAMYSYLQSTPLDQPTAHIWQQQMNAAIAASGERLLATFSTDPSPNNYPRHPIRTGVYGLIWFATIHWGHAGSVGRSQPLVIAGVTARRLIPTATSILR
jgi:hypothetical protein